MWFAIVTSHCVHPSSQVCVVGFSEVLVGGSGPDMHIHAQFEVLEKDDKTHDTFESQNSEPNLSSDNLVSLERI